MATPGFSISELITAAVKTKQVYDAFFHKYDNASNRVRDLRDTVDLFRLNLASHQWLLEQSGRTYPGLDAFNRTLAECNEFIDKYRRLLDGSGSKSKEAIRTLGWTFEDRHIGTLTRQLQLHIQALNGFTLNLLLRNAMERDHPAATHHHTHSHSVSINLSPSPRMLPQEMHGLGISEAPTRLQIERSESAEALAGLWQEVQLYSNRQKRRQNQQIQTQRTLQGSERQRRESMQYQAHQELQSVIEKWKAIARANGVDERSLPVISAEQPLETVEEFCKRVLQASEIASMTPISPMPTSPGVEGSGWPGSPLIRPQPAESIRSITPADSIWTKHSYETTATPISLRGFNQVALEPLDLPPPNVLECRVNLTLKAKDRRVPYPTLELKRVEVRQVPGTRDIAILCTTAKNVQIQHKLPHGTRTHPYTKHKSLNKPREVSFLDQHQIVQGNTTYTGDPTYTFFSDADCKSFQDSIRGKLLVHTWDIEKIGFRTSDHLGEATDQHLKIWREFDGGRLSITFFANNPSDSKGRRHREFPLSRLDLAQPNAKRRAAHTVRLEFKPARRPSLASTGSPSAVGLGFGDLYALPMGSYPSSVESTSPNPSVSPTHQYSPRVGGSRSPDVERSPETPTTPTQSQFPRTRRRSSAKGGSLGHVPPVQSLGTSTGTSTTLDELEGHAAAAATHGLSDEEAARLRFMDITFSEADDADKFEKLLPQILHI